MKTETNRKTSPVSRMQVQVESNGHPMDLTSLVALKDNRKRGTVRLILTPDKSVDLDYQGTPSLREQEELSKVEGYELLYAETDHAAKSNASPGGSPVSQLGGKPRTYSEALKAPPVVGVISPPLSPVVERITTERYSTAKAFDSHFHPDRLALMLGTCLTDVESMTKKITEIEPNHRVKLSGGRACGLRPRALWTSTFRGRPQMADCSRSPPQKG